MLSSAGHGGYKWPINVIVSGWYDVRGGKAWVRKEAKPCTVPGRWKVWGVREGRGHSGSDLKQRERWKGTSATLQEKRLYIEWHTDRIRHTWWPPQGVQASPIYSPTQAQPLLYQRPQPAWCIHSNAMHESRWTIFTTQSPRPMVHSGRSAVCGFGNKGMLICTYLGLFLFACLCFYFKFLRLSPTSRDTDRKLVGEKNHQR